MENLSDRVIGRVCRFGQVDEGEDESTQGRRDLTDLSAQLGRQQIVKTLPALTVFDPCPLQEASNQEPKQKRTPHERVCLFEIGIDHLVKS